MNALIYLVTFALSLGLSCWINGHESVINPDAICYLTSAEVMNKAGLIAGIKTCSQANWPFYSFIIAKLSAFTHFSYTAVAVALDSFFSALSATLFVAIVNLLGGTRRILWLAMAVILLSHEFNTVRQYIVRDHGYFAFYLASIFFLLKFMTRPRFITALCFSMSLIIAALFRIEGVFFLVLLPLIVWFNTGFTWRTKIISYIQLNIFNLLAAIFVLFLIMLYPGVIRDKLSRLPEIANQVQNGLVLILNQFAQMKATMAQSILGHDSAHQAGLVLGLTFLVWYIVSVMSNVSWIYGVLTIYAWIKRVTHFSASHKLVVYSYLLLNIIITFLFLLERLFLSGRYLIALSLILMLWVPFALNYLLEIKNKIIISLVFILILLTAIGGIIDCGYSKKYIHDAGDWLAIHVQADQKLYVNDLQLMYYSGHFGTNIFKQYPMDMNGQYDYIALRSGRKDEKQMSTQPIKVFQNKRGDNVSIYPIPKRTTP